MIRCHILRRHRKITLIILFIIISTITVQNIFIQLFIFSKISRGGGIHPPPVKLILQKPRMNRVKGDKEFCL